MKNFNDIIKNLKLDFTGLPVIKVALLGDSATQFLNKAIKGLGYESGINFDIYEAEFNQIENEIYDRDSELYRHSPDFILIFQSTKKLLSKFFSLPHEQQQNYYRQHIAQFADYLKSIGSSVNSKVIYCNFPEMPDPVFGHYANKLSSSFIYQLRKINLGLMDLAADHPGFLILDHAALQSQHGHKVLFDSKMYVNADMALGLDGVTLVANQAVSIMNAHSGRFKKCLILDLDNTLWGGIIGDDGIENIQVGFLGIGKAFTELQLWIRQLKDRGIILAVCSKNDEAAAKEPFLNHPDMVLRLDDFAVFAANWNNKADNIRFIQNVLNIGFDSMVFLDDSPFERNYVRKELPEILVPELPEDPADYLDFLIEENLFEISSFTGEDTQRTRQYQEEATRTVARQNFSNEEEYLENLKMVSDIQPFTSFNLPRVHQLVQRSNQFNLRTIRYSEEELREIAKSPEYIDLSFTLQDKYGDHGLISVIILKKEREELFIDTWIMSCRVLKRGMEHFTLNTLVQIAHENNFTRLVGEFLLTTKNKMATHHYRDLGFTSMKDKWHLNVDSYSSKKNYIAEKTPIAYDSR